MPSRPAPRSALWWLAITLGSLACSEEPVPTPVSVFDAGFEATDAEPPTDAGVRDADLDEDSGMEDAAPGDNGAPDAATPDAGDGGVPGADAGPTDAAPPLSGWDEQLIDADLRHGQEVRLVDLDFDGDLDVLTSISLTDTVRLYLNGGDSAGGGDGSFFSAGTIAAEGSIVAMSAVAQDLDTDGDLDVAAVGLFQRSAPFASPGDVVWYENPGDAAGSWTAHPIAVGDFYGPRVIQADDISGDGLLDLIVGATETFDENGAEVGHGLYWLRNIDGQSFTPPIAIDAGLLGVEVVRVADVNDNGLPDLIVTAMAGNEVAWYENLRDPNGIEDEPPFAKHSIATLNAPSGLEVIQLDGDGGVEIVVVHDDGQGGAVLVFDAPLADPRGTWARSVIATDFGGGGAARAAATDFNQDGFEDVVVTSNGAAEVRAFIRSGSGWSSQTVRAGLTGVTSVDVGDVDGDQFPDLATTTYENSPASDLVNWWRTIP